MQGGLSRSWPPTQGFEPTPLEREALTLETGAPVAAALAEGRHAVAALGDGSLRVFGPGENGRAIAAHRGGILALAPDRTPGAVLTGGDDGRFLRVTLDGAVEELASFGSRWVDHVAASRPGGWRACSSGRVVHLWGERPDRAETLEHPSTVGGLAFDPKGRQVAVAHYGGVTVWEKAKRGWKATRLAWAGSHIAVTWSPDGKIVVSSMQEAALHGWRLRDRTDMAMSGYPAKVRSLAWAGTAPHLVTSGADQAVCWPFDGRDGPMGRSPLCVAYGGKQLVTAVLGLPGWQAVMAGFQDGAVLLGTLAEDGADRVVRGSTSAEVTALALTADGAGLLIGDVAGRILWSSPRGGVH